MINAKKTTLLGAAVQGKGLDQIHDKTGTDIDKMLKVSKSRAKITLPEEIIASGKQSAHIYKAISKVLKKDALDQDVSFGDNINQILYNHCIKKGLISRSE